MSVTKRILVPQRRRSVPSRGWSWIDRRFLREHADALGRDALLLYFFLATVADKDGLSYYSDPAVGTRLRMDTAAVGLARQELLLRDLVAYQPPLYQLLSLPEEPPRSAQGGDGSLADLLSLALDRAEKSRRTP